jgi:hypothetical protein
MGLVDPDEASLGEGRLKVDGGLAFSGILGYRAQSDGFIYVSYSRQQTTLTYTSDDAAIAPFADGGTIEYFQFGGNVQFTRGLFTPYVGASIGPVRFASFGDADSRLYFAPVLDSGVKLDLHENVHLRLLGRVPLVLLTKEVFCVDSTGCVQANSPRVLVQLEVHAGIGVSF